MFPSPTKRNLTESNHAERAAWSPSRGDLDEETQNKLANIGRRARQSVNEGYRSPSASSPINYGSSYSFAGSPSTTPTKVRPGLAAAYASSPPAGAFISDRDARQLAAQAVGGGSTSTSSTANPFLVSSSNHTSFSPSSSSSSSTGMMDFDGAASTTVPRHPSPLKRTARARSRSPDGSPPALLASAGSSGPRKIRGMPALRATQSLPAPPPPPVFAPQDGYGACAGGWATPPDPSAAQGGDDAMGGVEEVVGGQSTAGSWPLGSVSEWARSEDF